MSHLTYFNPRSREGSDRISHNTQRPCYVSIHAPARGATSLQGYVRSFRNSFNPRSREGSDGTTCPILAASSGFQSTLPRGERPVLPAQFPVLSVSIHAPARGATFLKQRARIILLFQSTLPRGERHAQSHFLKAYCRFQSTLPRGERLD